MWILIIICIVLAVMLILEKIQNAKKTTETPQETVEEEKSVTIPYKRKNLLTKNEWSFYKQLKPIADKIGVSVLAKVRVADLVEMESGLSKSEWQTAFNRINKKHIDFMLCKPENLYPLLLIELDDSSHQTEKVKERDNFIEKVYEKTGYKLLRVQNATDLEKKIDEMLNSKNNEQKEI